MKNNYKEKKEGKKMINSFIALSNDEMICIKGGGKDDGYEPPILK